MKFHIATLLCTLTLYTGTYTMGENESLPSCCELDTISDTSSVVSDKAKIFDFVYKRWKDTKTSLEESRTTFAQLLDKTDSNDLKEELKVLGLQFPEQPGHTKTELQACLADCERIIQAHIAFTQKVGAAVRLAEKSKQQLKYKNLIRENYRILEAALSAVLDDTTIPHSKKCIPRFRELQDQTSLLMSQENVAEGLKQLDLIIKEYGVLHNAIYGKNDSCTIL